MSRLDPLEVVEPTAAEVSAAKRSRGAIAQAAERIGASEGMVRLKEVELPASVVRALSRILDEISEGRSILIDTAGSDDPELTTTQAARLLSVSRPTLINLLKEGVIPYRMVGTHRRLSLSDVLAYRESGRRTPAEPSEAEMLRGLEEMAEYTHGLGLGY